MPAEIVIVRHGQCIGNVADRASYKGDHNLFNAEMRSQKSSQWPLTSKGIKESELAGDWIRNNITPTFDYYFMSDYVRAIETAKHLGFNNSHWAEDILLREREWGGAENLPYPERNALFQNLGISLTEDSMQWKPPMGESMITIIKKMRLFLDKAITVASTKRIILVSHGTPLQALRVLQHQVKSSYYATFINGGNYIRNCHIFHYLSKRDGKCDIPMYSLEQSAYLDLNNKWIETIKKI